MDVAIFLGGSLNLEAARAVLPNANYFPPLTPSGLSAALLHKPSCIAIIDGTEAVERYAEIAKALESGIPVFGAAALGARCAVHYSKNGMVGVGKIFQEYLNRLYDPNINDSRLSLEDLVNIRQIIARAHQRGIISRFFALELLMETKARCYSRTDFLVLARQIATEYGDEGADFLVWLESNSQFEQCSLDALQLLDHLQQLRAG